MKGIPADTSSFVRRRTESLKAPVRLPQVMARTSRSLPWKEMFINMLSARAVWAARTQRKRRNLHGKYGEKRKWRGWIARRK
jgi:hypothetical protein